MLCWEPSRKLFLGSSRNIFFCESFAKVGYYESLSLYTARGSGRRMVPHICLPFIGSSQVSEDEASPQPNTMVLKHILAPAAGTAWCCFLKSEETRSKRSSQASKGEALREPNTKVPGVYFPSDAPPADGWGLRIGAFSRKFRESFAKEWVKVCESQSAFWREWPSKPCKKSLISNNLSCEGDSVMLAACLQGYDEVIRDNLVCDLAGDAWIFMIRETFLFAKNGRLQMFADKGF